MSDYDIIVAVFLCPVVALLTGECWACLRNRSYFTGETLPSPKSISGVGSTIIQRELGAEDEAVRKHGTSLRAQLEKNAQSAQSSYHRNLARGIGAIASAFIVLVAALTWAPGLISFAAAYDVVAFVIATLAFWGAGHWNQVWLHRRAKNELIRQWCVVDHLFTLHAMEQEKTDPEDNDLQNIRKEQVSQRYKEFADRVENALGPEQTSFLRSIGGMLRSPFQRVSDPGRHTPTGESALATRVAAFWEIRQSELVKQFQAVSLDATLVATHFRKRPETQIIHFPRNARRLRAQGKWTARALLGAFIVTFLLCIAKLIAVNAWLLPASEDIKMWLTFFILVFIGLASAASSLYLNQNNRSLVHRYDVQIRQMKQWLDEHMAILEEADGVFEPGDQFSLRSSKAIFDKVIEFEDVMIEELLDFIAITEHDTAELSPA